MTEYEKACKRAAQLESEARSLRRDAFASRPLPDYWRVGQLVRTLFHQDFAWSRGTILKVIEVTQPKRPAYEYQVFFTAYIDGRHERFWTTPMDVELVSESFESAPASGA